MGNSSKRDARRVEVKHRHAEVLALRIAGKTVRAIAAETNYSVGAVQKIIDEETREVTREKAESLSAIVLDRLDRVFETMLPRLAQEDTADAAKAAMVVLHGIDTLSKMAGLYASEKHEVTGADGGPVPIQIRGPTIFIPPEISE